MISVLRTTIKTIINKVRWQKMRYEECPHGVKREVIEFNIDFTLGYYKLLNIGYEILNSLMSEYTAMNPYT